MIALRPEQGVVDQKGRDFTASEIVDRGVPVGMMAQPRVFMFVKRRAVEAAQAVRVGGKMRRHPVDQHAQAGAVGAVDKARKAFDIAEPGRGRIKPGGLVAPAGIIGIFADRQEFDMGEAHLGDIGDQPVGQRVPGEETGLRVAVPRPGMHFVDADGLAAWIDAFAQKAR